jgi:2-keto-4-pentenoate hydratase/2-oxohepta-3-ene-1,7-dioic acid hydratase in catechol pathway
MADKVRDVLKPLAMTAPGFKTLMNGQWHKRKGEIRDRRNLNMWLDVNGEKRQRGNTKTMIFGCVRLERTKGP